MVNPRFHFRFVANNFSFIDPERIAVTGVSYGGYVAGLMLADKAKDGVSCGVSVTPVVDWRFYGKYKVNLKLFSSNKCYEIFGLVKLQESCWLTKPRMVFLAAFL
jgi:hypothetical protein